MRQNEEQRTRADRFAMCGLSAQALYQLAQALRGAVIDQAQRDITICYHGGRVTCLDVATTYKVLIAGTPGDELTDGEYETAAEAEHLIDSPQMLARLLECAKGIGRYTDGDGKITAAYDPRRGRVTLEISARRQVGS